MSWTWRGDSVLSRAMAHAKSCVRVLRQAGKPKKARPNGHGKRPARAPDIAKAEPALFDPLTAGETADALRTLTEDERAAAMAKVGRYRVVCTEPLVVKPPSLLAGHRLPPARPADRATARPRQ